MKKILMLLGLAVSVSVHAETNSIVGAWATDEILSQLGPSKTHYTFMTNGIFTVKTEFTHGLIPTMSATGKYDIVGDTIVMSGPFETNTAQYVFEKESLVINEGRSKVFRLKRK